MSLASTIDSWPSEVLMQVFEQVAVSGYIERMTEAVARCVLVCRRWKVCPWAQLCLNPMPSEVSMCI
jgi:hypothetical protein